MAAPPDLITAQDVIDSYNAASPEGAPLGQGQVNLLPRLVTRASRLVRRYLNRKITRATYDETYTIDPGGTLLTREYPINQLLAVRANLTAVLTIQNLDTTTNQDAWVSFNLTGDWYTGQSLTGITLTRYASGVEVDSSLSFATYPTIQALAAAINALGNGWSAQAISPYELWGTADILQVQGSFPALGDTASLKIHTGRIKIDAYDAESGIINIAGPAIEPVDSIRFGPFTQTSLDNLDMDPAFLAYRVKYDAGYDTVPEDLQDSVIEVVKAMMERKSTDSTVVSESDGVASSTIRAFIGSLPDSVQATLNLYRSNRA